MMMLKRYRVLGILAVAFVFCTGWGFLVHRTVHQLAVYQLPRELQPFFSSNMAYLVENAVRPDVRRNTDSTEGSKHFIDAEVFGDSALWKMPRDWNTAVARFTRDSLVKYGYVPYWVMVTKERLTNAFRQGHRDSILFYAADLGHYIADAHVPLHTSVNYDGQLTGQKGLHHLWESAVPELAIGDYRLYRKHKAAYLGRPQEVIWQAVQRSYSLLPGVFGEERTASGGMADTVKYQMLTRYGRQMRSYTPAFAEAYNQRLGPTINEQLLLSAAAIADFWYTCWVDAGRPDLQPLLQQPWGREQKKKWKKEQKAYRNNQLVEKGLLLSRKYEREK
ncbi:zinc dependent phospholipase C family protein [Paraflavisolibacter sp. H34]|uniref:zinc dependent phospholipase C family protein n=1 Tax=Huijunlia imazamoxiresistens TaxID=3127457 RepID=UPI00301A6498